MVVFDVEGCNPDIADRAAIETGVEARLAAAGWQDRSSVIAIEPELESWVWSRSPQVAKILGWTSARDGDITTWLGQQKFFLDSAGKPLRPKEAMRAVLRHAHKPPSSAIFRELAEQVGIGGCTDLAFNKLLKILREWFPIRP
jgi:hypothetical protein